MPLPLVNKLKWCLNRNTHFALWKCIENVVSGMAAIFVRRRWANAMPRAGVMAFECGNCVSVHMEADIWLNLSQSNMVIIMHTVNNLPFLRGKHRKLAVFFYKLLFRGPFYQHGLTAIIACISNHVHRFIWLFHGKCRFPGTAVRVANIIQQQFADILWKEQIR